MGTEDMPDYIQHDFFRNMAKGICSLRREIQEQTRQKEIEMIALQARLAKLRVWTALECADGCIRLKRAHTI